VARTRLADAARITLGVVRLTNGTLGLLVPRVLVGRIERGRSPSPAATYAFRMFGVRTILLGCDLLVREGPELRRSLDRAPLVHGSDTLTATLLTVGGHVPRRSGLLLVAVSATNTTLALLARRGSA
jgi:hypothetical protein